jgi:iron complex transport system ATP-binding protein
MKVIDTRELAAGYGRKAVVSALNLEVVKGQVVGVLGPNGSGKTTILKTICGLLKPVSGVVYLDGGELSKLTPPEIARKMAVVLTGQIEPEYLTVRQLVASGRYQYTGWLGNLSENDKAKVEEALSLVNAEYLAESYYLELSDGERQKVLLARALAQETEILALDEPTGFLDLKNRTEFMAILVKLSRERGITVILSLHEVDMALKCCDNVLIVKDGAVRGWGPPERVLTEEAVVNLYTLEKLNFNVLTGSIELVNSKPPEILVIAGNGSGVPVYRLLTRSGYGFATGILHTNDLDYHVSQSMGVQVVSAPAFQAIDDRMCTAAEEVLSAGRLVIDTGFPIGGMNQANLKLIFQAKSLGKMIISLRNPADALSGYNELGAVMVTSLPELIERINQTISSN